VGERGTLTRRPSRLSASGLVRASKRATQQEVDVDSSRHASDLEQIYRDRFSGSEEYRDRVWKVLTSKFFAQWIPPSARVLDLGCGYCEFINRIDATLKYGMDLNPQSSRSASTAVHIFEQDCSTPWPLPEAGLDVVFTSNFFEHLATKTHLERTLQEAYRCLAPSGRLIAMGPNIRCIPGEYWDFFDHYLPLTERSLAEVLRKCGFEIERVIPRFLPFRMSGRRNYPVWMLSAYLSLRPAWRLFGRQFLVIAKKPQ
jgi:SAM-dependent methyltransferase